MRIEHAPPLPRSFGHIAKGLTAEADIYPTPRARLAAKLLVFSSPRALRAFWRDVLEKPDLGAGCVGAVNALGHEAIDFSDDDDDQGRSRWVCDPRYFCIIGLCLNHLSMEVVTHEAVHAGFCYARRRGHDPWNDERRLGEEDVAYPAGRIAAAINRWLYDRDLYAGEAA